MDKIEVRNIPSGVYCYRYLGMNETTGTLNTEPCPYWRCNENKHYQESGYCTAYNIKDWEDGTLLWDMVKECGVNNEIQDN